MALKLKGSTSGFVGLDAPAVAGNNTLILPDSAGSAHQILANDITAGVTTFTQVTISRNGDLTVPGTISIGGTLTYEDVTSVDSVGIVTARGLSIFGNTTGLQVASGISTFQALTATTGTFSGDITANGNITGDNSTNITGINQVTIGDLYISENIVHRGDDNTRIRFPSADTIVAETGGTERLRIDSSGRLGLGENSPGGYSSGAHNLVITAASGSNAGITINNDSGGTDSGAIFFAHGSGASAVGRIRYYHSDDHMDFYTANTERLRIDQYGRVLIGGTSAIIGSSSEFAEIVLTGKTRGSGITLQDVDANVRFQIRTDDDASGALGTLLNTSTNHDMFFRTNNTERLRITSGGLTRLMLTGNSSLVEPLRIENIGSGAGADVGMVFYNGNGSTGAGALARIKGIDEGNYDSAISFETGLKSGQSNTTTERMRITSAGYMALGNTSPSQLLHVWPDSDNTTTAYVRITAGNRAATTGLDLGHDVNGNFQINGQSNGVMYFSTNQQVRMSLRNDHPDLVVGANGGWTDYGTVQAPIMAYGTSSYPANCHAMKAVLANTSYTEDGGGLFFIGARRSTTSDYTMAGWYTGNGSNAITADRQFRFIADGNAYADGSWNGGGADYAEFFEWLDGNSGDEDRKGISVVLDNGKIRAATGSDNTDNIIGVISANPVVVGDSASERWKEKWITDDFGAPVYEEYTITEWYDETKKEKVNYATDSIPSDVTVGAGSSVLSTDHKGKAFTRKKLNPSWDSTATYIPRKDRKEWDIVGLMGKLKVKSDQPIGTKWIKMREISASVHEYLIR